MSRTSRIVNLSGRKCVERASSTPLSLGVILLCREPMTDERLILAIGRLERALSRLESARLVGSDPSVAELQNRLDKLDQRHQRLRARTTEAVDQLGLLLDTPRAE